MQKVLLNSLPKSGTNMAMKLLELLGYTRSGSIDRRGVIFKKVKRFGKITRKYQEILNNFIVGQRGYIAGIMHPAEISRLSARLLLKETLEGEYVQIHMGYTDEFCLEAQRKGFKIILVIRDPRAILCSRYRYILKKKEEALLFPLIKNIGKEEALNLLIEGYSKGEVSFPSLSAIINSLNPWKKKDVLVIKYEELVGPEGGGTREKQLKTIEKVLEYLDIQSDDAYTEHLAISLYGGTRTFSKGQIDTWKEELNSVQKRAIKEDLKCFMQDYGYLNGQLI